MRWKHQKGDDICAALSWSGDYVISHRPKQHIVSYRPAGQHIHVGEFRSKKKAIEAAEQHSKGIHDSQ